MGVHCFDSSGFINPHRRYYPRDVFPTLWALFENRIAGGTLITTEVVRDEIDQRDDELKTWVRAQSGLVHPVDEEQQELVMEILARYPTWIDPNSTKNNADPFVIALAKVRDGVVVHDEKVGSETNPRIPFVCDQFKVRHCRVLDFMRSAGLRF